MPFFKAQWGMGWSVTDGPREYLYSIVAPFDEQVWAGRPNVAKSGYANAEQIRNWCVHEFGHSFVNPLTAREPHASAIARHKHLFRPIANQGQYSDWATVFNEYVVRAGEIQMAEGAGRPAEAERLRVQYRDWTYLPYFTRQLTYYQAHRKRYPTFETFLPTLIAGLASLEP